MRAPAESDIAAGEVILSVENVSLSFGGVRAIRDVSFDIKKGEVRAIIGPNGAGKTSMLNVINGFYHPQKGRITFKGETRAQMQPFEAARGGIARTFQNVALFKGMSALDNIMAGRTLKMKRGFLWQMLRFGPAMKEEVAHRQLHGASPFVRQDDLDVACELVDDLPARPARGDEGVRVGGDRNCGETRAPLGDRLEKGGPLGADRQTEGAVLDVASGKNPAGFRQEGRSDAEFRIG